MRKIFTFLLGLSCALAIAVGPVLAATGDPLPGVDILVKKKPSDKKTTAHFGSPDCPAIPADFFGPGSEPFTGGVDLKGMCAVSGCGDCDQDCDGPHSHADHTEGTSPEIMQTELAELTLRSIDPITVNLGTTATEFDVRLILSGDVSTPGTPCPGQFSMPAGTVLDPGVSSFVVDSFFDVEYRIEFYDAGTNNPAGNVLTGTAHLTLQDVDLPVMRDGEGATPVVLGYDGTLIHSFRYTSDGGGFDLGLESIYENVVANGEASWGAVKSMFR